MAGGDLLTTTALTQLNYTLLMIFFIKDFIKDLKTVSNLNTTIVSGKKMSEVDIKPGSSQVTLISKDNTLKLESDVQNPSIKQQRKCAICYNPALKYPGYGAWACGSCKVFFRRSIQNQKVSSYTCQQSQTCTINILTRKHCQFCRFAKCRMAGMQPSAVMSDNRRNCVREKRLETLQRKQIESWKCNCSTRKKVDNASADDKHYFHRNLKHLSHEDHCAEKINIIKEMKAKQEKARARNRRRTLIRREKRFAEIIQKERARTDNNTLENEDNLSDENIRIGIPVADMSENFMVSENELLNELNEFSELLNDILETNRREYDELLSIQMHINNGWYEPHEWSWIQTEKWRVSQPTDQEEWKDNGDISDAKMESLIDFLFKSENEDSNNENDEYILGITEEESVTDCGKITDGLTDDPGLTDEISGNSVVVEEE